MKKLLITLMCIIMLLPIAVACSKPADGGDDDKNSGAKPRKNFMVLSIGNSFSDDAHTFLFKIARELGEKNIIVANLYIGGTGLETHYNNAKADNKAYSFQLYNTSVRKDLPQYSIKEGLEYAPWDFVTIQQVSQDSGKESSHSDEQLNYMADFVREHCANKSVKVGWHSTWAYQQTSNHSGFAYYDRNQTTMYNMIVSAAKNKIETNSKYDFVIPNSTVIQNARTSYIGDKLTRDGYHLTMPDGRFMAGLGFYKALTGNTIEAILESKQFPDISSGVMQVAVESVNNAISKPHEVTQSSITVAP